MAGFVLAGAALALTGALAVTALELSGADAILGWWLLVCGQVVGLTEVLSLVHAIGRPGYAAGEAVLLAVALLAWLRRGRPLPRRPRFPRPRRAPLLAALAVVVLLGVGYELFVVVATPPNNWDSMHYHLARAAAWRAQGSLGYFPTHNGIENAYPQNAELLVLWTLVFLGRDLLAALPQLLAGLATAVAVYAIARRCSSRR